MANAIVKIKIMPESPAADRKKITAKALDVIVKFSGEKKEQCKVEEEPVAFGLVAVLITFMADENKGLPDSLTADLEAIKDVNSAEVVDFRRALG